MIVIPKWPRLLLLRVGSVVGVVGCVGTTLCVSYHSDLLASEVAHDECAMHTCNCFRLCPSIYHFMCSHSDLRGMTVSTAGVLFLFHTFLCVRHDGGV